MTLTATKFPDGEMYLQEENPHQRCTGKTHSSGCQCKEWYDFNDTHPPILALFKCTEGQRFEDGDVEPGYAYRDNTKDPEGEYPGYATSEDDIPSWCPYHKVYTLKSDKGGEKEEGKKEFQGTPGPWRWELHKDGKQLTLCGTGECGHYDFYVMDFERWGMSGATPRFRSGDNNTMCKAVDFGEIVKGREHHANWFQTINHPDAQLIAAAPELLEACIKLREFIDDVMPSCTGGDDQLYYVKHLATAAINKALNHPQP